MRIVLILTSLLCAAAALDHGVRRWASQHHFPLPMQGETPLAFLTRGMLEVHRATTHCQFDNIPFSFLQRAAALMDRSAFSNGLLTSDLKCGFCHQRAYRLVASLRAAGIEAEVYGIGGHVIARAVIDGRLYVSDPDYGVGPFPWTEDGAEIAKAYLASDIALTEDDRKLIAGWYLSQADNVVYQDLHEQERRQETVFVIADWAGWATFVLAILATLSLYFGVTRSPLDSPVLAPLSCGASVEAVSRRAPE